jgi:hypothetical protein
MKLFASSLLAAFIAISSGYNVNALSCECVSGDNSVELTQKSCFAGFFFGWNLTPDQTICVEVEGNEQFYFDALCRAQGALRGHCVE